MPRRLVIARIGVDAPVVHVPLAQQTWDLSLIEKEIAYLGSTAQPGEGSNVVLAGHVTLLRGGPGPFLLLESLQEGDPLVVHTDSRIHTYLVDSMRVVAPTDVSVVHATETSTLTLITCTTWDAGSRSYLERVVVTAHEVETSP
jgi:LPXTG-site transpeptidase (sortase) family protein